LTLDDDEEGPKQLKLEEIAEILAHGTFENLVGVIEDYYFEAKSAPYPIGQSYGRRELVAALDRVDRLRPGSVPPPRARGRLQRAPRQNRSTSTASFRSSTPTPLGKLCTSRVESGTK
jgi:hypothetical protein